MKQLHYKSIIKKLVALYVVRGHGQLNDWGVRMHFIKEKNVRWKEFSRSLTIYNIFNNSRVFLSCPHDPLIEQNEFKRN